MSEKFGMRGYMKGALLLTVAAIIVKLLSAVYRIPFQNLVGDQGFYIYQQVYPFISFFVVWTSSGFAVAISKMLADVGVGNHSLQRKSFISRTVFYYLTVLSLIFFSILYFGANLLAEFMGDHQLAPLLKTGSFVTLFMPILALMKGTFQSRGDMQPVAYAQIVEQFVRVVIILVGTIVVMKTSQSLYGAGNMAVLGTVVGEIAGVILLYIFMKRVISIPKVKVDSQRKWPVLKEVTLLSLSVSMSSLLLLCFQLIDSFTVYSILVNSGMEENVAQITKGIYDRGQPLVQLGIVIASSLSLAIVPLIAHYSKKKSGRGANAFIQLTYRSSVVFGVAASFGLVVVMPYVNVMLFETNVLTNVLVICVLQIIPLSIILTFTAILQGFGKLKIPALILLGAILLKLILNELLVTRLHVLGAALASDAGLFICAYLLMRYLKRLKQIKLAENSFYIKLGLASICMALSVFIVDWGLQLVLGDYLSGRKEAVLIGACLIPVGALVFLTIIVKTKILAEKEWFLLPFGRKMAAYQLWLNKKK